MPIEILMPALSPTMKEGNLAKWLKKEGEQVNSGDVIAEIETDKATMEVEAVDDGVIGKILTAEGSKNVAVNSVIALLLEDGETQDDLKNYQPAELEQSQNKEEAPPKESKKPVQEVKQTANIYQNKQVNDQKVDNKAVTISKQIVVNDSNLKISPVAKRIAELNNINPQNIQGSGPNERIIKSDIVNYLSAPQNSNIIVRNSEEISVVPNNNIRQVIAERLLEAKQTIPHFYLSLDCNITNLLEIRNQVNKNAKSDELGKPLYKISVNDLIIRASALALKNIPEVNASWNNDSVIYYNNIDISIAVSIADGLITPIIKNSEQKSIFQISKEMKELAAKARSGTLAPHEFQGGGFSISNLGMYGIKQFNAIVNPPQSAILSVGAADKKLILENNVPKEIDNLILSLSCDHRVVDGAIGAKFLQSIKHYLENPVLLLL
jgi:pyruvate dehydrogenase E2 component (dihydrolipoamide acetyltransferase)